MNLRMDEVVIYDSYSEDPDAENSVHFASEAAPVYTHQIPTGEHVLTTSPVDSVEVFGYVHVYSDPEDEAGERVIVVRR